MHLAAVLLLGLLLISPVYSFPLTVENRKAYETWLCSFTALPLDNQSRAYLDERDNTAVFLCLELLGGLDDRPRGSDSFPIYVPREGPVCTAEELGYLWSKVPELLPDLLIKMAFIPTHQPFSPPHATRQWAMAYAATQQCTQDAKIQIFSPTQSGYGILGVSTALLATGGADGADRYFFNVLPGHGLGLYVDRRKIIMGDQLGASWNDRLAASLSDPRNDNSTTCSRQELAKLQPDQASTLALWINNDAKVIEVRAIGRPVLRPCLLVVGRNGMAKVWPLVADDGEGWVPFIDDAYIVFLDDVTLSHADSKPIYDWKRIQVVGLGGLMNDAIQHMKGLNELPNSLPLRPIVAIALGDTTVVPNSNHQGFRIERRCGMMGPMTECFSSYVGTTPVYAPSPLRPTNYNPGSVEAWGGSQRLQSFSVRQVKPLVITTVPPPRKK